MPFADLASFEQAIPFLQQHQHTAYVILFCGALFETLIPFSLIVLGEVFFLSGAVLAGLGVLDVWMVMLVLFSGGILGDNLSYWLGYRYGNSLFERLQHWPLIGRMVHQENYEKGVAFFEKRGASAVFIARLSGPLSWITPTLAGIFRLNYGTFVRFNTPAVIIGISQFIILGYFFGSYIRPLLNWAHQYGPALALIVVGLIAAFFLLRRFFSWQQRSERTREEIIQFILRHFGLSLLIGGCVFIGVMILI
ncbi:MAG: hypothetical protein B7X37_06280 [Halothiobacillus sp. 14-55-98]|jgi:membrane-associated protein|nr:MAG: hypothetical protein B7X37_06280 [Halothiobacillus sp. 14-55-98]